MRSLQGAEPMAGSIGIKQANGDFYYILEENSTVKKQMVLTTVHDNQKSVQIDLYKSMTRTMADAMYIGSIVIENIAPKPKGEPSIEMTLGSATDGSITANAVDLGNPSNEHSLSVSLKSFEEDKGEYPDFGIDEDDVKNPRFEWKNQDFPQKKEGRKIPWLAIIIIGLVLILLCLGLWYFVFGRGAGLQSSIPVQTQPAVVQPAFQPAQQPAIAQQAEPPSQPVKPDEPKPAVNTPPSQPIIVERPPPANPRAADRKRPSAPVYSFNVPQNIPSEGIVYKVRWGDTLWDISEAFYRNPRLYTFIVRSNEIRNPNLIVSGTELTILPRN